MCMQQEIWAERWRYGSSKFPFWPLAFTLAVSPSHSSLSQALFLPLYWQALAGRFGGRGQINTPSNSCQLQFPVCARADKSVSACVVIAFITLSFIPFFSTCLYWSALCSFFNVSINEESTNIYNDNAWLEQGGYTTKEVSVLSVLCVLCIAFII